MRLFNNRSQMTPKCGKNKNVAHEAIAVFAAPLPTLGETKKAIWRNLSSIHNEVISLVAMCSKKFWLVQESLDTVKPDSKRSPCGMKTYSESMIKLQNQFLSALWAEKLGRCLKYCWSWQNTLGKLEVAVNLHVGAIWFEFWMKRALVMLEILSSTVLISVWCNVGDKF